MFAQGQRNLEQVGYNQSSSSQRAFCGAYGHYLIRHEGAVGEGINSGQAFHNSNLDMVFEQRFLNSGGVTIDYADLNGGVLPQVSR